LAVSPDGENIATAAADETLKFWKVFPKKEKPENATHRDTLSNVLELR